MVPHKEGALSLQLQEQKIPGEAQAKSHAYTKLSNTQTHQIKALQPSSTFAIIVGDEVIPRSSPCPIGFLEPLSRTKT